MVLNPKYNKEKWKFIAKKQRTVSGKLLRGNISGKGGFWLNDRILAKMNRILAEARLM